ncbi:hypothetical protein ABL78_4043 [Leptomonas seymouri]|uniref:OTU domain-containing protein n=1 Tax=Leptomonas seymouri TaxID=5684 RepID=A0A0N0P5V7_LEPSE|nr:hypothetical protein ABL78_4043 [Leptomonas seymouri]|eukprot:KPI86909.1 hypothetical protein ABL78_4043 [Leptomonas seymouri]
MELDALLDRKVEREKLSASEGASTLSVTPTAATATTTTTTATSISTTKSTGSRLCWLCNRSCTLRFRLQSTIFLCFDCFRISYLSLLLPLIDTPQRRKNDAAFLKQIYSIEGERSVSSASPGDESLASTYGEVIEPHCASFVMNSAMIRQRREEEEQRRHPSTGWNGARAGAITSAKSMWGCPRCTFLNAALARECEACGFVNPGTVRCPVCKAVCPIGSTSMSSSKSSPNACSNGELHRIWNCRECGALNTLDGDRCYFCHQPRYWACSQCTALHHMARDQGGLRYCPTCGTYNTPEDVLAGQAKIEKEVGHAELVTAHREVNGSSTIPATNTGDHEIVFGVNDSLTLEERARQKDIESNERRLLSRLNRLNISRNVQKTDGNCLFRSLANQLFGQPQLHFLVRALVVTFMERHSEDYAILFDGEAEWRNYYYSMKEQGTWGDELCLNAAARCFHVNIHVITSDHDRWHIVFQYEQLGQSTRRCKVKGANEVANNEVPVRGSPLPKAVPPQSPPVYEGVSVFLAYLAPVHYDDITPSPVKPLMLSGLLSGELNNRVKAKQRGSGSSRANSTTTPPLLEPTAKARLEAPGKGWQPPQATDTSGAMPTKVSTAPTESTPKSCVESSAGSNAAPRSVPRSRPQSTFTKDGHDLREPPPPPSNPPTNFRIHGDYGY